ncbi:MAG: hypothetical protein ABWZ56_03045 [Flavobacterium sp.]
MTKFKSFFVLLLLALSVVSCDPNDNNNNSNNDFAENFGNETSKDFLGQVVDENNNPIQNVAVKIGSSTAQTDVNGVFIINSANVFERFAYITAKKAGFIDGSRAVVPSSGTNRVKIMMLSGNAVGTVNTGVASDVVLPNGTKVVFDGNFKTETGSAYSGTVNVIMHHLDPADPNIADKMPGMLLAENADGAAKVLETYGMMNVELRGSGGEKLQISNTAQIEMPITATQLATAPATIPLWHFDETLGYWKEEGSATKQGNKYVGTVSHFSWWNCDTFSSTIFLTITVVNSSGNPISNVGTSLTVVSNNFNSYIQFSNANGQVSGLVPANEILAMNIYDNCGNVINTTSIGPFSANTTLPSIVVTNGLAQSTTVQGSLLKCDNSNVTNGYVLLDYGNQTLFSTVTNGNFSFNTLVCSSTNNSFTLEGYDYDNLQTTGVINYTFTTPTTNVGNLTVCNAVTEFISYQIDNNPVKYIINNINAGNNSSGTTGLSIYGYNSNQQGLYIWGSTIVPGIYTTAQFSIEGVDVGYISSQSSNTVSFNLSNFGSVGQYIDMTFNGTYTATDSITNTLVTRNINGIAHVLRDN